MTLICVRCRGYSLHAESETSSDGDGGPSMKLRGRGHVELSKKGIPHGILHFPRQLQLAGHIYMHDTTQSEGCHRLYVKKVMDRVRKLSDYETSAASIDWVFRVRTWAKVIDMVNENCDPVPDRRRKRVDSLTVVVNNSKMLVPSGNNPTFSPLRSGNDRLLCNDARLSYNELATLVSSFSGLDLAYVMDHAHVQLYCSAYVRHPGRERRTYWSTETRYPYNGGYRRDFIEVDLGQGKTGAAAITAFIVLDAGQFEGVIVRWLSKSSLSTHTDDRDRPLCDYPLSSNHCLWEWSDAGRNRHSFRTRGFTQRVNAENLWGHVEPQHRQDVIRSEIRARYDIIGYDSIIGHANISVDPSTGHMLQTLQIV